ncbi:MAG: HIT domain-containing protein [Chlorobiaceae bacterium]|nr:HIT domain-containing protein [Chlorobiaceae bacterium]
MQRMYSPWREVYMQSFKDEKTSAKDEGKSIFADIPPEEDEERYVLHRAERCFAIMNLYPYNCGHLMVIPYRQTPEFTDLDDETKLEIMQVSDLCMRAMKTTLNPQGFNLGANLGKVAGGSVDTHIHFHIVPRWEGDTNFMPVLGDTKVLSNDLRRIYIQLREAIADLQSGNAR